MNIVKYEDKMHPVMSKVLLDLAHGIKVLGNYNSMNDVIRVWTNGSGYEFLIVATSSKRFGSDFNSIEIQSFSPTLRLKVSFCSYGDEIRDLNIFEFNPNYLEIPCKNNELISTFLGSYLTSEPDFELTKKQFFKETHRLGTYEFMDKTSLDT
jgi:hypothetical protein